MNFNLATSKKRCRNYRKKILEMSQRVTACHVAPAFSCLEIVDTIYHELMRQDDTFVMSKGHGCLIQYVILNQLGILTDDDLLHYDQPQGRLGAHPDYGTPGVAAATGSLGHGTGMVVGMAYANKIQHSDVHTYLVVSDGELQEGSTWEAMMMAANLRLDNITMFIDLNDFSGLARMSETHQAFYPVTDKIAAFGWEVLVVEDGHDAEELFHKASQPMSGKPRCLVCKTVKGKGASFMEHVPIWHYRSPSKEEYVQALAEIEVVA